MKLFEGGALSVKAISAIYDFMLHYCFYTGLFHKTFDIAPHHQIQRRDGQREKV